MSRLFSRWLPCLTLGVWSAILLYFYFSGRIQAFLVPMFRPYVLITGVVMAVMAIMLLFGSTESSCCAADACSHSLSRSSLGKLLTFLILLLPVTTAAFFSPDAFGKAAVQNRGIITDASALGPAPRGGSSLPMPEPPLPTKDQEQPPAATTQAPATGDQPPNDYLDRTAEGHIVAEVLDLLYAAQDNALRKDFEGKTVQLVGQLMPDSSTSASGKRFKAVRMFMTCCAADARPVATLVEAEKLPDLPEMTWVKVVGTSTFPIENGRRTAVIKASTVEKTSPPEESMLY